MAKEVVSKVNICDDVICVIAGVAATSVNGVKSILGGYTKSKIPFLDSNKLKKGIELDNDKTGLKIRLSLVLNNATNIQEICVKVQEKVKETIEGMMNVVVKDVAVRVENIVEEKNEK